MGATNKSAKLRVLRALVPYVPRAFCALVPHVIHVLLALVLHVPRVPQVLMPHLPPPPFALLPYVPRALHALVQYVPCVLRALVPYVPRFIRALVPPVPRVLRAIASCAFCFCLLPCVLYDLISPFVLLSFHASRFYFSVYLLLVIFLGEFTKVKTNIVYQQYFEVSISIY